MIMIHDVAAYNFTAPAQPEWLRSDRFDTLLNQGERRGLLEQLRNLLSQKG